MTDNAKALKDVMARFRKSDTSGVYISGTGQVSVDVNKLVKSSEVQEQVKAAQRIREAQKKK